MEKQSGWYNGYSPAERDAKFKNLKQCLAKGTVPNASGSCAMCGDPDSGVEYHSEDYSSPYLHEPPATYALCRHCHRNKLHKRFSRPASWHAFLAHIRRGGYARDLRDRAIKKEFEAFRDALERGESFTLRVLRPYMQSAGSEWFSNLRMDAASLTDPTARPRP